MKALQAARPELDFAGIGGPQMAAEGLDSLFPMSDLSVMGVLEVVPQLVRLRARLRQTALDIATRSPDAVVTIDSPGFALRLLRKIRPLGIPRIHYVAPQAWAWRESRVRSFPGLWEKLLCLLPFEPAFFARHGLAATFVGHPVVESGADRGNAARFHADHGIADGADIVVLMPGSRGNEAPRLLPVFGATIERLARRFPGIVPVVPVSAPVSEIVHRAVHSWPIRPIVVSAPEAKYDAYAAARAALTKSGTSTLELALAGLPMAVTYRVNPITAAIARRVIRVPHVAMVNLLAGAPLVPELLQEACNPTELDAIVTRLIREPAAASAQKAGFPAVLARLRSPEESPSAAAAREVLKTLDEA